jgi:hypothetical protein
VQDKRALEPPTDPQGEDGIWRRTRQSARPRNRAGSSAPPLQASPASQASPSSRKNPASTDISARKPPAGFGPVDAISAHVSALRPSCDQSSRSVPRERSDQFHSAGSDLFHSERSTGPTLKRVSRGNIGRDFGRPPP